MGTTLFRLLLEKLVSCESISFVLFRYLRDRCRFLPFKIFFSFLRSFSSPNFVFSFLCARVGEKDKTSAEIFSHFGQLLAVIGVACLVALVSSIVEEKEEDEVVVVVYMFLGAIKKI